MLIFELTQLVTYLHTGDRPDKEKQIKHKDACLLSFKLNIKTLVGYFQEHSKALHKNSACLLELLQ